jgi:predicted phosphodiesterase
LTADDFKIGVISDTHLGSVFTQMTAIRDFYKLAEVVGCECVLHCGDLVEGVKTRPSHLRLFDNPDILIDYVVKQYPKNLTTYWISGNHDRRLLNDTAVDVSVEVGQRRRDLVYLGNNQATMKLHGLDIYMHHVTGWDNPYQHMYTACSHSVNAAIVLCGHLHIYANEMINSVPTILVPGMQATPPYMFSRSSIGGIIITLGEDRSPNVELITYSEANED